MKRITALLLTMVLTISLAIPASAAESEQGLKSGRAPLAAEVDAMLQSMPTTQTIVANERDMVEKMIEEGTITHEQLNEELSELAATPVDELREKGYNDKQVEIISSYNGGSAFTHVFNQNGNQRSANSGAEVCFRYGLAGTNTRKTVTIAYDILWSECPFFTFTDSFGIGWIAADVNSYELMMKTDSSMAQVDYYDPDTEEYAYLYRDVDMDTSSNNAVIGTPIMGSAQGNYGKHISGITQVSTQSDSYNLETIHIFVTYAHTTLEFTFNWEVALEWKKVAGVIQFLPKPRHTIIAEGDHTFRYNSQGDITADVVD